MRAKEQPAASRPADATGRRSGPGHPGLLALQRASGNRAVAALVTRSTTPVQVQRAVLPENLRGALVATSTDRATPVQRTLVGDLQARASIIGPPDHDAMIQLVRAAPVPERQAALADTGLMHLIGSRFDRAGATLVASTLLEGSLRWTNPPNNDFFHFFKLGTGNAPSAPNARMNCWESIMYAAYLVGVTNAGWIKGFYDTALKSPDPNVAIWALLGWTSGLPAYNPKIGRKPKDGDLVFYQGGGTYPGHVAVYVGGGQVISLWNQPNGVDSVQRIGISELAGTITFKAPPW